MHPGAGLFPVSPPFPNFFMPNPTYEQLAERLDTKLEDRATRYGQQFSEFKVEHLSSKIRELIANFQDGTGTLKYADIEKRIVAAFPANDNVHKSRQ